MGVSFKSVILREPHDVQSRLTRVHSVQSVHTMAIHPNTQVGSKLLLCSARRGTCYLQAKLSKLQRHYDTQAKTTSNVLLSWTTAEIFTSANQKVHTCSFLPTHTTTYKNKFLCLHIKNCQELTPAQRKVFKRKHILLRNTNGWMLQNQANRLTAHTTSAVRPELHCPPAEEQRVGFLIPRLVGKKLSRCVSPMKGNVSWGLSFRLKNVLSEK